MPDDPAGPLQTQLINIIQQCLDNAKKSDNTIMVKAWVETAEKVAEATTAIAAVEAGEISLEFKRRDNHER